MTELHVIVALLLFSAVCILPEIKTMTKKQPVKKACRHVFFPASVNGYKFCLRCEQHIKAKK